MADSILDDLLSLDNNRSQAIKTNEITGNRFIFHSLPKEFQDWNNIYYVVEKESNIDKRSVSDANLNGYMWKAIFDGAEYGIALFFGVMWAAVKIKLTYGSTLSALFSLAVFFIITVYVAYHGVFYSLIKAQIVGPVTKRNALYTVKHYTSSFWGVFSSLLVAFAFTLYTLYTLLPLFAYFIYQYDQEYNNGDDSLFLWFEKFLIVLHNGIVKLGVSGEGLLNNVYILLAVLGILASLIVYYTSYVFYRKFRKEVEAEVVKANRKFYYPIQVAQRVMKEWKSVSQKAVAVNSQT